MREETVITSGSTSATYEKVRKTIPEQIEINAQNRDYGDQPRLLPLEALRCVHPLWSDMVSAK